MQPVNSYITNDRDTWDNKILQDNLEILRGMSMAAALDLKLVKG